MFKSICPKLNNHLTVYRGEDLPLNLDNTKALIKSQAGDYIRFNNYLPTTINIFSGFINRACSIT